MYVQCVHYLFTGSTMLVTNNTFHCLNSEAIWSQRLTSVLLTINHRLAVTAEGGGNDEVVDDVSGTSTCE